MRTGFALAILLASSAISARAQATPAKVAPVVSFCELVSNPGEYDGKVISVRAKVSWEFEDFTLFDTNCAQSPDIWIDLGGDWQCTKKMGRDGIQL